MGLHETFQWTQFAEIFGILYISLTRLEQSEFVEISLSQKSFHSVLTTIANITFIIYSMGFMNLKEIVT